MHFPISGAEISPLYLVVVGFLVGVMGGFFGVGGSFIAGPALRAAGLNWNFAVGTDLAHIVGKSVVAAKRHRALGNVDLRLGLIMAVGTIGGAEVGVQLIEMLKRAGNVNSVVSIVSITIYVSISTFMIWESWKTLRLQKRRRAEAKIPGGRARREDESSFTHVTRSIQRFQLAPDDLAANLRREIDFNLVDHSRLFHRRGVQRISRRRRRLHPHADAGLRPRDPDPSGSRNGSF